MIIGIVGRKGSGKTSAANRITEKWDFKLMSFARPLKEIAAELFNVPIKWMYDEELKNNPIDHLKNNMTPRKLLQWFGTEIVRGIYPDAWIDLMSRKLSKETSNRIVIDDVRFWNEAYTIQNLGGHLIGVSIEGEDKSDMHGSERFVEPIQNTLCERVYCAPKGLPALYSWVDDVIGNILTSYDLLNNV
jgi:hypothetical protein